MRNSLLKAKKKFKAVFQKILEEGDSYEIGEAAIPAYANNNILIDYLFWKRIDHALLYVKKYGKNTNVLDFGCGTGVVSYILAKEGYNVTALDIDLEPFKRVQEKIHFPKEIKFIEGDLMVQELHNKQFDIILALDVLEHIEDIDSYLSAFKKLMAPDGIIIISGPSENKLYQIGRKIAGKRFTGDYHVTNILTIRNIFKIHFNILSLKRLFFPIVLFEVFVGNNSKAIK